MAKIVHVSAVPGQPSTLWQGASGKYYRRKAQAESDSGLYAITPESIEKNKQSFFVQHKLLCTAIIAALIASFIVYTFTKK